jgi:hypothetical protein
MRPGAGSGTRGARGFRVEPTQVTCARWPSAWNTTFCRPSTGCWQRAHLTSSGMYQKDTAGGSANARAGRGAPEAGSHMCASQASSVSSTRLAMRAPQSHAIHTTRLSTPASRSPHSPCSVKKASTSVSRLTAQEPTATGRCPRRSGSRDPPPPPILSDRPAPYLDLQPPPRQPAFVYAALVLGDQPLVAVADNLRPRTVDRAEVSGFWSNATEETLGTASFSSSNCFGTISAILVDSPVILPPGRARVATSPCSTGSPPSTTITGMAVVTFVTARATIGTDATMASNLSRASSEARLPAVPPYPVPIVARSG